MNLCLKKGGLNQSFFGELLQAAVVIFVVLLFYWFGLKTAATNFLFGDNFIVSLTLKLFQFDFLYSPALWLHLFLYIQISILCCMFVRMFVCLCCMFLTIDIENLTLLCSTTDWLSFMFLIFVVVVFGLELNFWGSLSSLAILLSL